MLHPSSMTPASLSRHRLRQTDLRLDQVPARREWNRFGSRRV